MYYLIFITKIVKSIYLSRLTASDDMIIAYKKPEKFEGTFRVKKMD
jgi:hypothetical protein